MAFKDLNDMQKAFIDALFDPVNKGDYRKAARLAGYSDNRRISDIIIPLKDIILERTKDMILGWTPKALITVVEAMDDPAKLGTRDALSAAKDILDRAGVSKENNMNQGVSAVFILPPKDQIDVVR